LKKKTSISSQLWKPGHDPGMAGLVLVRVLFLVCRWGLLIVSAHGLHYVYGDRERERERERSSVPWSYKQRKRKD
jgi:hypothetical protein